MNQRGKGHSQDSGQQSHAKNTNEMEQMMGNRSQGLVLAPSSAQLPPMAMVQTGGAQYGGTPLLNSYQLENEKREIEIRQRLKSFWDNQIKEIKKMGDIKNHCLPLARIKKIMKADEDVKMISSEAPMVFAKACEMFILELTLRSWYNTEENKRRTLLRSDVTLAITRTDIFDFLVDIIPREESSRDDSLYSLSRNAMPVVVPDAQAFYTMLPQNLAHPRTSAEIMNRPAVDPNLFRQHIPYMPPVYWYPQEQQQDQEEEQQQQQQQPPPPPPSSASDS